MKSQTKLNYKNNYFNSSNHIMINCNTVIIIFHKYGIDIKYFTKKFIRLFQKLKNSSSLISFKDHFSNYPYADTFNSIISMIRYLNPLKLSIHH